MVAEFLFDRLHNRRRHEQLRGESIPGHGLAFLQDLASHAEMVRKSIPQGSIVGLEQDLLTGIDAMGLLR